MFNELLVATRNLGKFKEIKGVFSGLPLGLLSLEEYETRVVWKLGDPLEDGLNFRENAYRKARYFFEKIQKNFANFANGANLPWILAEDSGILVEALPGELGVKTRRWGAGEKASDEQWIEFFLRRMKGMCQRGATFVCEACIIGIKDGEEFVRYFEGETKGVITEKLEAKLSPGVPLSSCFKPEGFDRVYSALSVDEKNRISHRGKAMAGVRGFLIE